MTGDTSNQPVSAYQPSPMVAELTRKVQRDYSLGEEILHRQYLELNNRNVIDDENRGQFMFNAFVDTSVEDPNEAWKWRGTRSMARNKAIAMHANLTASFLLPLYSAQSEDDEVDEDFSETMRDIIEWMANPSNSNYQSSFLQVVFGMLTNPVTYLGAEFCEVMQTVKDRKEDGTVDLKDIIDEELSGFNCPIWSSSQILITNAFERNIQKQRAIIKRRFCDKGELEAKYGSHPHWKYVQEGIRSIYNEETGLFYDVKDTIGRPYLVSEEIWENRRGDLQVPFINGIYMGDENVDDNPISHRDNFGAPKYNVVPFGYSRIGEHFFYFKSMMNCLGWDNDMYDAMSEVVMNRSFLEVEAPLVISGSEQIDSDIVFPNSVTTIEDKDAKVQRLLPESNLQAGFGALRETAESMSDASGGDTISGNLPLNSQRAYTVAMAQASAKKLILGISRNLGQSMYQFGDLMKDIAVNHVTVPQVDELAGETLRLKYRTFMIDSKIGSGKQTKKIKFDSSLIGTDMTDDEKEAENIKLLEANGYPQEKYSLRLVNPELFAKYKFLTRIDIEEMVPKNSDYWQPILMNLKTVLAKDPYTDQEKLTKELMHAFFQSRGSEFVKKPAAPMQSMPGQDPNNPNPNPNPEPGNDAVGGQLNQKIASRVATGAMVQ